MGIVGQDLVHEHNCESRVEPSSSTRIRKLQTRGRDAHQRRRHDDQALEGPEGRGVDDSHSAREFFKKQKVDVNLLEVSGSVEIMVALGLADGIVDLVESGDTLRDNGLSVIETIAPPGDSDPGEKAARRNCVS